MRTTEAIALDALRCAISHEPDSRLIGNVTAAEVVRLCAREVMTCPKCGAEAWVNIDCDLCLIVGQIANGEVP